MNDDVTLSIRQMDGAWRLMPLELEQLTGAGYLCIGIPDRVSFDTFANFIC